MLDSQIVREQRGNAKGCGEIFHLKFEEVMEGVLRNLDMKGISAFQIVKYCKYVCCSEAPIVDSLMLFVSFLLKTKPEMLRNI